MNKINSQLINLLSEINDKNTMQILLDALLTNKEIKEVENRIKIFQLLNKGIKHRQIADILNVGIATVTRGSNTFEKDTLFSIEEPVLKKLNLYKHKKLND